MMLKPDLFIGEAISTSDLDAEEKAGMTERVYEWIREKVESSPPEVGGDSSKV